MGIIYDNSLTAFIVINFVLAGAAAWLTGRALARSWSPVWLVFFYMLLLALPVRFFHWSLADGTLLSLQLYIVDTLLLIAIAFLSYRIARTTQMVTQYPWLSRPTSIVSWDTSTSSPPS